MKNIIKLTFVIIISASIYIGFTGNANADRTCDASIIISNNSLFEITLTVDGMPMGNLLVGKTKTYPVNLPNDAARKIKVKVEYQDPDYIDPKSLIFVSKNKMECNMVDTMYVAFTK